MLNTRCGRWAGICREDAEAPWAGWEADITCIPLPHPPPPHHFPFPHWKHLKSCLLQPKPSSRQCCHSVCVYLFYFQQRMLGFALFCAFLIRSPSSQVCLSCSTALKRLASEVPALGSLGDTRPMLSKELLSSFISFSWPASFYF